MCLTDEFFLKFRFTGAPTPTYPIVEGAQNQLYKSSGIVPVKRKSLPATDNES